MSTLVELLNAWGGRFVDAAWPMLWQSCVLMALVFALDAGLRKRVRATTRYALWLLVLVKLLVPTSFSLPTSVAYWLPAARKEAVLPVRANEGATIDLQAVAQIGVQSSSFRWADRGAGQAVQSEAARQRGPTVTKAVLPARPTLHWPGVALLLWFAGMAALCGVVAFRARLTRRMILAATATDDYSVLLERCAARLGMRRRVTLKLSGAAPVPAVCGLFRPVILLPTALAARLNAAQMEAVLLHELAHVRRGDPWVNYGQALLQVLYFYNPLLWLANAAIRHVREEAVDELVLVALADEAALYPETLLQVAKFSMQTPHPGFGWVGILEKKSTVGGRIRLMLNRPWPQTARLGIRGGLAVLALAAVLLPMKSRTQQQNPAPAVSAPSVSPAANVPAQDQDFLCTTNDGTITIVGYIGRGGEVIIPGKIHGLPVTSIGNSGFLSVGAYDHGGPVPAPQPITSLTIPDSVTAIGPQAFQLSRKLTNVTMGRNVATIGGSAFADCPELCRVSIQSSLTSIENGAFNSCAKLTDIKIPNTVTNMEGYAFGRCASLTSITIPNGVSVIRDGAFAGCSSLTNVTIPNSVTKIERYAFGCSNLAKITIPASVSDIENYAFDGCVNLTEVDFQGNAPRAAGANCFHDDNGATVYYLPGTTGWGVTFGGRPAVLLPMKSPVQQKGQILSQPRKTATKSAAFDAIATNEQDVCAVEIQADGGYWLDGKKLPLPQVESELVSMFRENPKLSVGIRADERTQWKAVDDLVDVCTRNHIALFAARVKAGAKEKPQASTVLPASAAVHRVSSPADNPDDPSNDPEQVRADPPSSAAAPTPTMPVLTQAPVSDGRRLYLETIAAHKTELARACDTAMSNIVSDLRGLANQYPPLSDIGPASLVKRGSPDSCNNELEYLKNTRFVELPFSGRQESTWPVVDNGGMLLSIHLINNDDQTGLSLNGYWGTIADWYPLLLEGRFDKFMIGYYLTLNAPDPALEKAIKETVEKQAGILQRQFRDIIGVDPAVARARETCAQEMTNILTDLKGLARDYPALSDIGTTTVENRGPGYFYNHIRYWRNVYVEPGTNAGPNQLQTIEPPPEPKKGGVALDVYITSADEPFGFNPANGFPLVISSKGQQKVNIHDWERFNMADLFPDHFDSMKAPATVRAIKEIIERHEQNLRKATENIIVFPTLKTNSAALQDRRQEL